ncbi:peptidase [Kitasatospora sp. LaBMicrA B282]|uniref:peptidase n=1 Tax=Kitasatospora sp. LaBMicrA B282 TaxID=3420949 RepID=UPI003D120934
MSRRLLAGVAVAASIFTSAQAAHAAPAHKPYTVAQLMTMDGRSMSAVLNPLRAAAGAIDAAGRGPDRAIFSGVQLDPGYDGVDVYLTDVSKVHQVIADANRLAPGFDTTLVKVFKGAYTQDQEHAARDSLFAQSHAKELPYTVTGVGAKADGTGLTVEVNDVDAARKHYEAHPDVAAVRPFAIAGPVPQVSVPMTFSPSKKGVSADWSDTKWHDGQPFIGGDVLTTDGGTYCTAGLPTVRNSDGRDILLTAGHCFGQGQGVYTGGGNTGDYFNGQTGNWVGTEIWNQTEWDMEELDQGTTNSQPMNNADESDTDNYIPLTSVSYSYNNDFVCQDGAVSYFSGHGTPCWIKVYDQDFKDTQCDQWGCHEVRGVRGNSQAGDYWGAIQGDSGAVVFTISGDNSRQARGQISMVYGGGYLNFHGASLNYSPDVFWTEAPDILGSGGLSLNSLT